MSDRLVEDQSRWRRAASRVGRHWRWGRTQGFGRLVEEDQLNPLERIPVLVAKWRWRRAHRLAPGSAVPVWVVGVQRSGTNMLVRGLETSPEFEVRNENDKDAFERFRLRPDPVVRALVDRSRHRYVLLKPLCDSHRVDDLLDALGAGQPGRALWTYRGVDGRVRSAVQKFGGVNRSVLREIAEGRGTDRWQAQRLSRASLELISAFDYDRMSEESAAALFWYVRNALFFERGLDRRDDVLLVSYDSLVADPEAAMQRLCRFLDFPYHPRLVAHVSARPPARPGPLDIDPEIRARCDDLQRRLDAIASPPVPGPAGSA